MQKLLNEWLKKGNQWVGPSEIVTFVARHRINLSKSAPSEVGVPGTRQH